MYVYLYICYVPYIYIYIYISAIYIYVALHVMVMAKENNNIYKYLFFFCHHHHMECLPFSDLRIFLLSIRLCEWLTRTPFLLLVYYLFFCWIFAVALVWCLGIKFHKLLLDFICRYILPQHSGSCLPDLGA